MAISSLSVLAACVSNQPHHSRRHREQANPIRGIIEIMDVKENMAVDYGKYDMESLANIDDFDKGSGSWFERLLFNNRVVFLLICVTITAILGFAATQVRINADFNDTIPTHQPYIRNYLQHFSQLQLGANSVQIAVTANQGAIIDKHYLDVLQHMNDEIYVLPGVNQAFMTSLWTPSTRWVAVTSDGLIGGPVIGSDYDGSPQQLQVVRRNILSTGKVGSLVSDDFRSSMITVPLLEKNNLTGKPIDYGALARHLNEIRAKYDQQGVTVRITGFAMVVGDMINGIDKVLTFFAVSLVIAASFLFWYTRCVRSTLLVVFASLTAVTWQMGLLTVLGFDLTPYSVLVPFLVFAIGMSHGAQKMNGVMQDIGRGTHPLIAARYTFRRLFLAGFAALMCDMTSFAVLMTIRIVAIQQLALIACIGVGVLVITNLMMLPTMLSFTGVSRTAALRSLKSTPAPGMPRPRHPVWDFLDRFTTRNYAIGAIACMVIIGVVGWYVGRGVQIGDLQPGAPELRQASQYNRDNAFIVSNFTAGSDTYIVFTDTPPYHCVDYDMLATMDRLQWQLDQLPIVESSSSAASFSDNMFMMQNEGAPKWYGVEPTDGVLGSFARNMPDGLVNFACTFAPIYISLTDHRAKTLETITNLVENFITNPANHGPYFKMSLAGGNAGIEAATNIVIQQANRNMLLLVYAVVIIFCLITFRSWRAVICAVVPLTITSILAQALMVWLHIGVKVATLPVTALGVGIGVDYALYVLSIMLKNLRQGASLSEAYHATLLFTGRVVILTGITLATGVATWIFAPIKFQADMGVLLSFMFLWNMLGAMILLPALAYFLLPPRLFKQQQ
jgi:predicted RND superfamily exporter protein